MGVGNDGGVRRLKFYYSCRVLLDQATETGGNSDCFCIMLPIALCDHIGSFTSTHDRETTFVPRFLSADKNGRAVLRSVPSAARSSAYVVCFVCVVCEEEVPLADGWDFGSRCNVR